MAAISPPPGACFRTPPNLSSTFRPGSIPIPIRCRICRPNCLRACRMPAALGCARRRCRESLWRAVGGPCGRRAGHADFAAAGLPVWSGRAAPRSWRRPIPNTPAPRRSPAMPSPRSAISARRRCRSRYRHQSEQSGWPAVRQGRLACASPRHCSARGGMLVVDEAFMDVGPRGASLAAEVSRGNIVVLRSFGKFFGLAGLRLGFALAAPPLAARLAARSVRGRFPDRRSQSARRRWRMRLDRDDAARLGAGGGAARCDADRCRARHRRRHGAVPARANGRGRAHCFIISDAPAFWCARFPDHASGCALACRRPSRSGGACRLRWLPSATADRFEA